VLSKVGLAIRKLKELVVLSKPDFTGNELLYIENSEDEKPIDDLLLKFESPLLTAL